MHCVDWIAAAKLIKKREIEAIDLDKLEFRKSNSNTDNTYAVSFGNEIDLPSCTFSDWQKTKMLCKYLLGVMKNIYQVT